MTPPSWSILKGMIDVMPLPTVCWWPQTLGWQLLASLQLLGILVVAIQSWRRFRFNRYRRLALATLAALDPARPDFACALFLLLKQTACQVNPALAPRLDPQLLAEFDRMSAQRTQFDTPLGQQWLAYQIDPRQRLDQAQHQQLQQMTLCWLRQHRHPGAPALLPGGYQ
ncbi:DUF4381 family protein [Aeromonas enteropelogenes]|uniref:DUF4381 family protein n=1 Tax=Aeromonas enteropelogenes TaxID=29489 RepID=UPI003B9ECD6B